MTTASIPQAQAIARLKHLWTLVRIAQNDHDIDAALRVIREIRETERHTGER